MFTYAVADQMNEIFFRRKQQILDIDLREGVCGTAVLATGLRNLECLGYMFRKEDVERLRNSDEASVVICLDQAECTIQTVLTNDPEYDGTLQYSPMYPDFPQQVMEASEAELFINAMLHYLTDGQYMPDATITKHARSHGDFVPKSLKTLALGTMDEFKEMFRLLMNAATSISQTDTDDLGFFFRNFDDAESCIPPKPAFKENSAILAKLCVTERHMPLDEYANKHAEAFRNPTDVLRLAAALSDGDVSLAEKPRFRSFTRSERKALLCLLEGCTSLLENMTRRRETWLRLGEALHPGDYPRFAKVNAAYMKLRTGDIPMSFTGQFNIACENGDFATAVQLMSQRPGEFARNIDMMLRRAADTAPILEAFDAVADKVAARVLLELREHFAHRSSENWQAESKSMSSYDNKIMCLMSIAHHQLKLRKEIDMLMQEKGNEHFSFLVDCELLINAITKTILKIVNLERKNEFLSNKAIMESTFEKSKINEQLKGMSENNDGLTKSLAELAFYLTNEAGLKGTDENSVSMLKIGRKQQRELVAELNAAYDRLMEYLAKEIHLLDNKSALRNTKEQIAEAVRGLEQSLGKSSMAFPRLDNIRVFFPKGSIAKSYTILDMLPGIPRETSHRMVEICENALVRQYANRERLGKVYVSDELSHYLVPFSQRSASKALRTIVRGSRIPWEPEAKVVRGFTWWKNCEQDRTDIDLSAMMLDEYWKYVDHISYTNLRSPVTGSCHSGDIVDAPNGAAEYIDIDIAKAKAKGVRYVVFNVYGFTQQPFCDIPECSFGWMERENAESGQIFEAASVRNKIDLSCNSMIALPVIFDLEEGVAIWMDMALKAGVHCINLENNARGVIAVCRAMLAMHKPNLYDLVQLHIRARGEQVDDKSEADVVFDVDEGITPYDVEEWMANYI